MPVPHPGALVGMSLDGLGGAASSVLGSQGGVVAAECQQSAQDILQGMGSAQRSCTDQHSFATADYGVGWESTAGNGTAAWAHSAPDLAG